jgi:hypothetical protein
MAYTQDGIMAQVYVAFGQGTGPIRVSQDACTALYERYYQQITATVLQNWGTQGVQVLERFRALGRLMAANASAAGKTTIVGADVPAAAGMVEKQSSSDLCTGA